MTITTTLETLHKVGRLVQRDQVKGIKGSKLMTYIKGSFTDYQVGKRVLPLDYPIVTWIPDEDVDAITEVTYYLAEAACIRITW